MSILSRFGIWIAAFFSNLFTGVVTWLAQWFTRRFARVAAGITLIVAGTAALMITLKGLLVGISFVVPDIAAQAAGHVIPDNALLCFSSIVTAKVVKWTYDWSTRMTMMKYLGA